MCSCWMWNETSGTLESVGKVRVSAVVVMRRWEVKSHPPSDIFWARDAVTTRSAEVQVSERDKWVTRPSRTSPPHHPSFSPLSLLSTHTHTHRPCFQPLSKTVPQGFTQQVWLTGADLCRPKRLQHSSCLHSVSPLWKRIFCHLSHMCHSFFIVQQRC